MLLLKGLILNRLNINEGFNRGIWAWMARITLSEVKKKSIQRVYKILGLLKAFRNFSFFTLSLVKKKIPYHSCSVNLRKRTEKERYAFSKSLNCFIFFFKIIWYPPRTRTRPKMPPIPSSKMNRPWAHEGYEKTGAYLVVLFSN